MKKKIQFTGDARVIIDKVTPCIEGGLFPFKSVIGDTIHVNADIFLDGHDKISAVAQYRKRGEKAWKETPLTFVANDNWLGEFTPEKVGVYEYNVAAWVNEFATWLHGLHKKADEDQDLSLEFLIGAKLIEQCSERANNDDAKSLTKYAETLKYKKVSNAEKLALSYSDEFYRLGNSYPNRSKQSNWHTNIPLFVECERAAFSSWYEFFPRSFAKTPAQHGTFDEAQSMLEAVADMGFHIAYLPPIHPIGKQFRKGRNNALEAGPDDVGSPWAIGSKDGGHKSIEPKLGDMKSFERFVGVATHLGIDIALDIAFQCSPDHPYVKDHPEWFTWRPDGSVQYAENPPKKYQDILPFNFECEEWEDLWQELKSVFVFWIKKGVRIFRVDNPHTKPIKFWQWVIGEIKEEYPDIIFLAEAFTRPRIKNRLGKGGFTHGYTYFTWRNSKEELTEYLTQLCEPESATVFWPNFWPNTPDILHEVLQTGGRSAFMTRLILATTLSSNYGIYGPAYELCDHVPYPGKEEYNNNEKYELKNWNWDAPGNIRPLVKSLNNIRNTNPALQRTFNLTFIEINNPSMIAYIKCTPDLSNIILVVVNLALNSTQEGWVEIPIKKLGIQEKNMFKVEDLLPDTYGLRKETSYMWQGAKNYIKLDSTRCPAHVFRIYREVRKENNQEFWV